MSNEPGQDIDLTAAFGKIDPNCGNGVLWSVYTDSNLLGSGAIPVVGSGNYQGTQIAVKKSDFFYFILDANGGNDQCDSTSVSVRISGTGTTRPAPILLASINGVPIPSSGGTLDLPPSVNACGGLKDFRKNVPVQIQCVDSVDMATPVPGCDFILSLSQGPNDGGHAHNLADESRPLKSDPLPPILSNFQTDVFLPVDTRGNGLIYDAPEITGDVILEIAGRGSDGNFISGPKFKFQVKTPTSFSDLTTDGLIIQTGSHPGQGKYGTAAMKVAVSQMVAQYYETAQNSGVTNPDHLVSEAASLQFGGLFDANWNGAIYGSFKTPWLAPHCTHRDGKAIDLSLTPFSGPNAVDERTWLRDAATDSGIGFYSIGERPQDLEANHWHGTIQ